ncbi:hypothetical protein [Gramella sp. AN32]|uniref:Uncharacterized protein n=1 Tax=Christiangramia antarctica TaxID=2058158 RepID=A0ABW5X4P6_9FLAO|nr:hypothetical protein [Gramella sp. AN32]MCM4157072.1 hypothetical protein [Gramella sp. AN32]
MKTKFTLVLIALISISAISQELPTRVGLKAGLPNAVGVNAEYVTPYLKGRLAPNVEASLFPIPDGLFSDRDGTITYLQGGFNYYFFKPGDGLYSNLSYGYLKGKGTGENIRAEKPNANGEYMIGKGYLNESNHSINLKVGNKFGNKYYFKPEVGYAFNKLNGDHAIDVRFADGSRETQYEGIPGVFTKGLLFGVGAGIAF